jgi:RHS repeat-associated protein
MGGPLAEANTYRFSSKEWCANAALYYYGYRFYEPNLQRWLNRDPIQERGGLNLFIAGRNALLNRIDPWGLYLFSDPPSFKEWDFGDLGKYCLKQRDPLTDAFRDQWWGWPLDQANDEVNRWIDSLINWANPFEYFGKGPGAIAGGLALDAAALGIGALYVSERLDSGKKFGLRGKIWENDKKTCKISGACYFEKEPLGDKWRCLPKAQIDFRF